VEREGVFGTAQTNLFRKLRPSHQMRSVRAIAGKVLQMRARALPGSQAWTAGKADCSTSPMRWQRPCMGRRLGVNLRREAIVRSGPLVPALLPRNALSRASASRQNRTSRPAKRPPAWDKAGRSASRIGSAAFLRLSRQEPARPGRYAGEEQGGQVEQARAGDRPPKKWLTLMIVGRPRHIGRHNPSKRLRAARMEPLIGAFS